MKQPKTLRQVTLRRGETVVVRLDLDVPIDGRKILDTTRIDSGLRTVRHLLEQECAVIVLGHLGRPKGKVVKELSLQPVCNYIAEQLDGVSVTFCPGITADCDRVTKTARKLLPGQVLVVENLRFVAEEEANDQQFGMALASLGAVYVFDAFATAHRKNASTHQALLASGIPCIGFSVAEELDFFNRTLNDPQKPLVVIVGGAKISDKITVLNRLAPLADQILIGGAMAHTFFLAKGVTVGTSLAEVENVPLAQQLITTLGSKLLLPEDLVVAASGVTAEDSPTVSWDKIPDDASAFDIGPATRRTYAAAINGAKTILWNGPMGKYEDHGFEHGTFAIADAIAESSGMSVAGGGQTGDAVRRSGKEDRFDHVSLGGGAFLELLEGRPLPAILAAAQDEAAEA